MRVKTKPTPYILLALSSFLPLITLILYCFEYSVSLYKFTFPCVILAIIFIVSAILFFRSKELLLRKCDSIVCAILPFFSATDMAVCVFKQRTLPVAFCIAICLICSVLIATKSCNSVKAKTVSVINSTVLTVIALAFSFIVITADSFSTHTVKDVIYSPDRTCYAEVVDIDQGALGGNTVIYVHKSKCLNLFFITVAKTPQRVYTGEWQEYKSLKIQWKDNDCLTVNSTEYSIEA